MADTQTLLDYLSVAPPSLPTGETNRTPNTTNEQYNWMQIRSIGVWPEFNYAQILQQYGHVLQAQINREPMPDSPPQEIRTEPMFANRFATYVDNRLRRALRTGFRELTHQLDTLRLTPLTVDLGDAAQIIDNFRPDLAFSRWAVSWKWDSSWATSEIFTLRREYLQVLSQVNFYMKQHSARYGFVITDTELVPIKRLDANGNLLLAQPVQWDTAGPGRLTILLGLWYLGMLGAADEEWQLI
ncbi:hypothetical protein BDV25DRAFT_127188 [Aspergillus avenaceus]|uniref:Uncharacterized protein n=1 Tax=Aspergillus avenaceus TaxID=36643 RepID=A0A5N6U536_ASPAV|nr:hypothetical protein BDV25DRAFT_127188 [Aspergillus avenaceus]